MEYPARVREALLGMLDAIAAIRTYVRQGSAEAFAADGMAYDAALMRFVVLGEFSRRVPEPLNRLYTARRWGDIAAMRNWIAHGYDAIEPSTIWEAANEDLPLLEAAIRKMLVEVGP